MFDFKCPQCETHADSRRDLWNHVNDAHTATDTPDERHDAAKDTVESLRQADPSGARQWFTCPYCEQRRATRISLKTHLDQMHRNVYVTERASVVENVSPTGNREQRLDVAIDDIQELRARVDAALTRLKESTLPRTDPESVRAAVLNEVWTVLVNRSEYRAAALVSELFRENP